MTKSHDGSGQSVGITALGETYTWGPLNGLGQLGRSNGSSKRKPRPAQFSNANTNDHDPNASANANAPTTTHIHAVRGFAGGTADAGHTAILDSKGGLWMTGCDRWQQLGLGSSSAGAAGYTWTALWQTSFQYNPYIAQLMMDHCGTSSTGGTGTGTGSSQIRDVALGGDHTLILSSNQRHVFSFGKGSEGQLGLTHKPFVSSPAHAKELSVSSSSQGGGGGGLGTNDKKRIGALCAIQHCSIALDEQGEILKKVGKCFLTSDRTRTGTRTGAGSTRTGMEQAFQACRERAKRDGLVHY
jgi:alpha-tubulin suppressor-like RCC1 family protein